MSGEGFGRSLRAVPYWPCTVQIFVRYEIRDPKEYFLKFWAESIQPLSSSCHFKNIVSILKNGDYLSNFLTYIFLGL